MFDNLPEWEYDSRRYGLWGAAAKESLARKLGLFDHSQRGNGIMKVDRQQLLDDGYIIIRECIPPDKLEGLRVSYEAILERQKAVWARERAPDDPPGGLWEKGSQPRVGIANPGLVDDEAADAVEIWLHENTLGVAQQLLCLPSGAVSFMSMMCSPVRDHGPGDWHRDVHPIDMAPLRYLQEDILENGPRDLQWNIPLYDDSVLWVVPGSHRRLNTNEENAQLLQDPKAALPGGVPVALNAGDGVVYINRILHWGSSYSPRLRRTLHGGHSILTYYDETDFLRHLSSSTQDLFAEWSNQSARSQDRTESTLRAAIDGDAAAYREGLEALQPGGGEMAKKVLTVYMCKAAYHIRVTKMREPELQGVPEGIRRWAFARHPTTLNWGAQFRDRFSPEEADLLWERFAPLDAKLQADTEQFVPGYQSGPMRYYFEEVPEDISVEALVSGWD